ncbi:Alpha-tubulin suppressor [Microbacterium sp. ru370.1]|uniref:RCC1 domain-containing protein n=1 Tax=unclassified Microbacterium TaxID=2609290 RepID=UPI000888253D|nr:MULTISPECIES: hypothetical protein [unclassified Microbacterium]SDO42909.1 Alpha-tubulin suppressor [Microbacterium sp. ru370.1]SIT80413.1 Alpha-tubulin suppressor [Microbacterium sp. RU1D]
MTETETPSESSSTPAGLSRRAIVGSALWATPAIVAMTSVPAFAASNTRYKLSLLPVTTALASGGTDVTGVLTTQAGVPAAGQPISLTLGTSSATGTTDGSGKVTKTLDLGRPWAQPGSTTTVTALSNNLSESGTATVLGANLLVGSSNYTGQLGIGSSGNDQNALIQTSRVFPSPVVEVSSSGAFAIAVLADGTAWTTGWNNVGALGDGTTTDRSVWGIVPGLSGVVGVATTIEGCHALTSAGEVWSWGKGEAGQLGQADSSKWSTITPRPQKVAGISGVTQIASITGRAMFALKADGTVWSWGDGYNYHLGDGTTVTRGTPAPIPGLTDVVSMASGFDGGLVLKKDGTVWAWGNNANGQLCDGTTNPGKTPQQIPGLTGITQLSAGPGTDWNHYSGYALKNDGTVWAWGSNEIGQLGDGTTIERRSPVQVKNLTGVKEIAGSIGAAFALLNDGRVAAWGQTFFAGIDNTSTPGFLTPSRPVTKIRASQHNVNGFHGLYLITGQSTLTVDIVESTVTAGSPATVNAKVSGGSVGVAGAAVTLATNRIATLGATSGTTDSSGSFQTTVTPDVWTTPGASVTVTAADQASQASDSVAVVGANLLVGSSNYTGQLGIGSSGNDQAELLQTSLKFPSPVVEISGAGTHALALLADGTVWSTGSNGEGSLGDGTKTDRYVWGIVPGLSNVISITTTMGASHALTANGDVWAWGDGVNAQLGQEDSSRWGTQWPSPQKVKSLPGATQLASTSLRAVFALMSDGTVKSWGAGWAFQRGDADGNPRGSAATVAGLSDVVQLGSGFGGGGLALKSDGTVWAWGNNDKGQLCDGTTTARSTPVQIPGLTGVTQVSGGPGSDFGWASGYALKSDGTVWAWGENGAGQLGDGTTTDRNVPVQVKNITTATQISGSITSGFALLADNRVAAWGETFLKNIGTTSTAGYVTPVRPVTKLRASQHNKFGFHGLFLITE